MKKTGLFAFGALCLLTTACNPSDGETTTYNTFNTINHITDLSTGEVTTTNGDYKFFYNFTNQNGYVSTENLVFDNATYSFRTDEATFLNYYFNSGGQISEFNNLQGLVSMGGMSLPLKNASIGWTTMFYWYTEVSVPGINGVTSPQPYVTAYYEIGSEYAVRTFARDSYFMGTTQTSYVMGDAPKTYTNEDMIYRFVMDLKNNTADMVIYKARFAEEMPMSITAIVIKGLTLTFTPSGYTITGEKIIPSMLEGGQLVEMPAYIFDSVNLVTTNNEITHIKLDYNVAGRYQGVFTGSAVYDIKAQ